MLLNQRPKNNCIFIKIKAFKVTFPINTHNRIPQHLKNSKELKWSFVEFAASGGHFH